MTQTASPRIGPALATLIALATAAIANALSVQDIAQLRGYGESQLWGLGFVTGLSGTGDGNDALPLARQIAAMMHEGGNPVPNLDELFGGANAALVQVTCTVPKEGAKIGDKINLRVTSFHRATSLAGGTLFITPLRGPLRGQGVYAFGQGQIEIDGDVETSARIVDGAQMAADIDMNVIEDDGITLQLQTGYQGWANAKMLANMINQDLQGLGLDATILARALDARAVRVDIPPAERANPTNFLGRILAMELDETLLANPARIIVNRNTGMIAISGDVTISPTVLSHRDLVITILEPPPPPGTPERPLVHTEDWARLYTGNDLRARARLEDLIKALEQLDVPPAERVDIIVRLADARLIHGELIIE